MTASAASRSSSRQITAYFSIGYLLFAVGAPAYGAASTAFTFLLKDSLGLGPTEIAFAGLLTWIPLYASFVFGFVRDRWSPLGLGDRGYLIVFGVLGALPYLWLGSGRASYLKLVVAFLAITVAYRFLGAALGGVQTAVGQRHHITGRLAALIQGISAAFWGASFLLSGALQGESRSRWLFRVLGILTLSFALLGVPKPKSIYAESPSGPVAAARPLRELARLVRHLPLWPALFIWLLFQCGPWSTPLAFYMTDDLHGTQGHYAVFMAIASFAAVPGALGYSWLCKRANLRRNLWVCTPVVVVQLLPLLFVHTPNQALLFAAPVFGLAGGLGQCVYWDLLLRSFPKGLEGTGVMMADMTWACAVRLADLLGAWSYDVGGFKLVVVITTAGSAAILPMLMLVSREVTAEPDAPSIA